MEQVPQPPRTSQQDNTKDDDNRRHDERRKKHGKGFVYLSMVGWYCRRERSRRKGDSFT